MTSYFNHIITANDSKKIYRMNQYGQSWDNWTTESVIGQAVYPSAIDVDHTDGSIWWASEHNPSRIVHQTNEGDVIDDRLMSSIDPSRSNEEFSTEAVIVNLDGTLTVLDDFADGTIYHLARDFSVIRKIENTASLGLTSMQGGCLDYWSNTLLIVDNTGGNKAIYRLDSNFTVVQKFSLENGISPELYSPQDLAFKEDGTFLLAGYANDSLPESDTIYHLKPFRDSIIQIGLISVEQLEEQKNPTGISIYRSMWGLPKGGLSYTF